MKKFLFVFITSLCLFGSLKAYASDLTSTISELRLQGYKYIFGHYYDPERPNTPKNYYLYACNNTPIWAQQNDPLMYKISASGEWIVIYTFYPWSSTTPSIGSNNEITYWELSTWQPFTLYNGDINEEYPNFVELSDDFINTGEPQEEPKWYEEAWDIFKSWLGNTPWDDYNIPKMISEFWKKWVNGGDDPNDINIIDFISPTPWPTPTPRPTPIPYSISIVEDQGNQLIIYNYTDPTSGLPTSSPFNPNIQVSVSGGGGCNLTTPVPVQLVTGIPSFQPLTFTDSDNNSLSINTTDIGNYIDVIETGLQDNTEAMQAVADGFSVIPEEWFAIIGIIACIPIIAAVISRFLH